MAGDKITIHGSNRASRQERKDILVAEWSIGPYTREVVLPQSVNGPLTHAAYGNSVLVLAMPKVHEERDDGHAECRIGAFRQSR
jgi:HSP20 family molecular chaperone IbpA